MDCFYSDTFVLPLPPGHRFPMEKYSLLRERVAALPNTALHIPEPASDTELLRAHLPEYVARATAGELTAAEIRRIGFPWSPQMIHRSRRASGATVAACRSALRDGIAANLAGGTHHACRDHGEGFCVFNDGAVAARAMQAEGRVRRVLIIDCDVHQGNGTADTLHGDDTIFTFSIHGEHNFPFRKIASDLDIGLPDGTTDDAYLSALADGVRTAIERADADMAIYLSGADPYHDDKLGRLALTKRGLATRDELVFDALDWAGLPFAITMGGGYGRIIADTVDIHGATISAAARRLHRTTL